MTIQEANSILFGWFIKNDSINNEEFSKLTPKKTSQLESEAAFSYALADMEIKNLVAKFIGTTAENKAIFTWILKRPLILNKQTLELDGGTAIQISNVVNDFYSQMSEEDAFCNPLQITQEDIHILIEIIHMVSENHLSEVEENKDKKP